MMSCSRKALLRETVRNEKGIALFLVLWVLTLLTVIVGEFCYSMRTELTVTRNFKEDAEAYYIAGAGVSRAIAELIRNEVNPPKADQLDEETPAEDVRWRVNTEIPAVPFGEGSYTVRIGNESGKVNINSGDARILKVMLNAFDMDETEKEIIVDSILDWRDGDSFHRFNGAEDDYYRGLPEPYECRDGDFESIEELLLVRGVTPEIFYGGLRQMVTVYVADSTATGRKTKIKRKRKNMDIGKININAAPLPLLCALPGMTEEAVAAVQEYRREKDFTSLSALAPLIAAEVYSAIVPYLTLNSSPFYSIVAQGTIEGSRTGREVKAFVQIDRRLKTGYRLLEWNDAVNADPGRLP